MQRTPGRHGVLALFLAVAVGACGADAPPQEKSAAAPLSDVVSKDFSLAKGGPSVVARRAHTLTTLVDAGVPKNVAAIALGETKTGALRSSDPRLDNGAHINVWTIRLSGAQAVDISLASNDFDTYLVIFRGRIGDVRGAVGEDDDGGGGTNSRWQGTLEAGDYLIGVTSFGGGQTGSYTLSVAGPASTGPIRGSIAPGQSVTNRLTSSDPTVGEGKHINIWQLNGNAGDQVTITLTSTDFDAYLGLMLGAPGAGTVIAEDDDGAGGTDSRITHQLPETGRYTILVTSFGAGATGAYQLEVAGQPMDFSTRYPGGGNPNGKYAVVVGIDDYPGTRADLRGPVDDATLVRDVLVERFGFPANNVVFIQDSDATREHIAHAIVRHLGQAGPNGTAVFFYSGHGMRLQENIGLTGRFDPEPGNQVDEAFAVYGGAIIDDEMGYLLQQLRARNTLVIVDACHSGTITRGPDAMAKFLPDVVAAEFPLPKNFINNEIGTGLAFGAGVQALERALSNPDRHTLMAASTQDQVSWAIGRWPDRDGPASLYTYYWAKLARSMPLTATFRQLHRAVSDSVNAYVGRSQGLSEQTPQLAGPHADVPLGTFFGVR